MSFTYNGKTLNKLFRQAERQAKWLGKLHKNCGKKLARAGKLLTLHKSSLKPSENVIRLVYTGEAADLASFMAKDFGKISRAMETQGNFVGNALVFEQVSFSRITATVEIGFPFEMLAQAA